MSDEPFGRQLRPVKIEISGGEDIDQRHWAGRLTAWLNHQPCATMRHREPNKEVVMIYPDANND